MDRITVSEARESLEDLLTSLTSGYWDSNDLLQKDTIFDMITTIYGELNEISKLSVNDYHMGYEPITANFPACLRKFKHLQQHIDDWFPRTETAESLQEDLAKGVKLISTRAF